jgi:S-adenosylmethionine hydrolase
MTDKAPNVIALITDFGTRGLHYVASMKGVILKINPYVSIVDITHEISSYSIIEAAYLVKSSYKHFPKNTVFIMVVDPGVGSSREILAIKSKSNHVFIGPNNGVFSNIMKSEKILMCVEVKHEKYFNLPVSSTFHGRDIMAPVAAHVSNGVALNDLGPYFDVQDIMKYPIIYELDEENKQIEATIQYIDSFGNLTTNIPIRSNFVKTTALSIVFGNKIKVQFKNNIYEGKVTTHFNSEQKNALLFLIGSSGFLEISKNQGDASKALSLKVGDTIKVMLE